MSEIVDRLLKRNLYDVFGERDGERRRAAIAEVYAEDCIFSDHFGRRVGHAALEAAVVSLQEKLPTYVFSDAGPGQSLEDSGRILWRFGPPEDPARLTGVDFIVVRGDRIAAVYTFLDGPAA